MPVNHLFQKSVLFFLLTFSGCAKVDGDLSLRDEPLSFGSENQNDKEGFILNLVQEKYPDVSHLWDFTADQPPAPFSAHLLYEYLGDHRRIFFSDGRKCWMISDDHFGNPSVVNYYLKDLDGNGYVDWFVELYMVTGVRVKYFFAYLRDSNGGHPFWARGFRVAGPPRKLWSEKNEKNDSQKRAR